VVALRMSLTYQTIQPSTGEVLDNFSILPLDQIPAKAEKSLEAFHAWKRSTFDERSHVLLKLAERLRIQKRILAKLMASEMGKPISSGLAEIEKCALMCEYYAENGEAFLRNELIESDASTSYISYQPMGPVFAVMPWNFPFWQVLRFAAPALMAGNTAILKHASICTQCALEIEKLFLEAGAPKNVFQTLRINHEGCETLLRHPAIQAATVTGSTEAGRIVAGIAASELKKVVLELGGSDPYLVLADADPEQAAEICVTGRMINNGESCIAAKRFITQPEIHDAFVKAVVKKMKAYNMGDPLLPETTLGPMASDDIRSDLHKQVSKTLAEGAECLLGGELPEGKGFFYPATVLTKVTEDMTAAKEELFGPVACILAAKDEEDAIRIANQSDFGLGAAVITKDLEKGQFIAEHRLEAGCCFVNTNVKSDPRLPFGGIKKSGFGRELSYLGIREFTNIKTVYVA